MLSIKDFSLIKINYKLIDVNKFSKKKTKINKSFSLYFLVVKNNLNYHSLTDSDRLEAERKLLELELKTNKKKSDLLPEVLNYSSEVLKSKFAEKVDEALNKLDKLKEENNSLIKKPSLLNSIKKSLSDVDIDITKLQLDINALQEIDLNIKGDKLQILNEKIQLLKKTMEDLISNKNQININVKSFESALSKNDDKISANLGIYDSLRIIANELNNKSPEEIQKKVLTTFNVDLNLIKSSINLFVSNRLSSFFTNNIILSEFSLLVYEPNYKNDVEIENSLITAPVKYTSLTPVTTEIKSKLNIIGTSPHNYYFTSGEGVFSVELNNLATKTFSLPLIAASEEIANSNNKILADFIYLNNQSAYNQSLDNLKKAFLNVIPCSDSLLTTQETGTANMQENSKLMASFLLYPVFLSNKTIMTASNISIEKLAILEPHVTNDYFTHKNVLDKAAVSGIPKTSLSPESPHKQEGES